MSTTTERVTGMGIRAYLALGLTVMALLFAASFFYFMSMTREMSVAGTKTSICSTQAQDKLRIC